MSIHIPPPLTAHWDAGLCSEVEMIRTAALNAHIAEHGGNVSNDQLADIWGVKYKTASGVLSKLLAAKLFTAQGYGPDRILKPCF